MKAIIKFLIKLYYIIFYRVEIVDMDNWYYSPCILCSNHISNHDPVVLATHAPQYLRFMAKKQLFEICCLGRFLRYIGAFPVNREGNDITTVKTTLKALKNNESVMIFPEGTRNKTTKPLPAKGGIVMLSIKAKVPILPITVDSTYKLFSRIRVTIHPIIDLSEYYGQKLSPDFYNEKSMEVLNQIYNKIVIYQGRK